MVNEMLKYKKIYYKYIIVNKLGISSNYLVILKYIFMNEKLI